MSMCVMCVCGFVCHHHMQRVETSLWSQFSPSTFMCVLGLELRSLVLYCRHLYLLSHLLTPVLFFNFRKRVFVFKTPRISLILQVRKTIQIPLRIRTRIVLI